ncbi:hypothetical protein CPHO_06745 [Corynebacterium phocae]|uniref:Secreted protein n=1 Tax=Corynebacterium phocae TaxID=161895 RepID=A0A1L7D3B1_9CORY|nr:hypothetical protein CPHO_06745 [Corynebacterium phocae]
MGFAALAGLLVLVTVLTVGNTQHNAPDRNTTTSTQVTEVDTSYWNKERMESASPVQMPSW